MKYYVVLDTNVVVSALFNRQHQAFPGQALCGDAKRDAGNPERK